MNFWLEKAESERASVKPQLGTRIMWLSRPRVLLWSRCRAWRAPDLDSDRTRTKKQGRPRRPPLTARIWW